MGKITNENKGITLIALVITIVVLLILARSEHSNFDWRERITKQSTRSRE